MGKTTGIQWADSTWNPWRGCTKVSPGCDNCYMFRDQERFGHDPTQVVRCGDGTFRLPLGMAEPRMVFTCSWGDWFHHEADPWRAEAWDIVRQTPHLTYQILTKRPALIRSRLPKDWGEGYPNVWLGVSAEDQRTLELRLPLLCQIPAALRFLSLEPLLKPVQLVGLLGLVKWVIVGGESGPGCRPMDLNWTRLVLNQCLFYRVPAFVKQLGGWPDKRGDMDTFPPDLRVRQLPEGSTWSP